MNSLEIEQPDSWVDNHSDALYRFAMLRISDSESAKDLVQETLIAGIQALPSFQGGSTIRTWLTGILKHKIMDHYRKSKREVSESQLETPDGVDSEQSIMDHFFRKNGGWKHAPRNWEENAESILMEKQKGDLIFQCIEHLAPKYKKAFLLKEIDEVESEEICQSLGLTSSNLWVILHRSRLQLRKCIEALLNR